MMAGGFPGEQSRPQDKGVEMGKKRREQAQATSDATWKQKEQKKKAEESSLRKSTQKSTKWIDILLSAKKADKVKGRLEKDESRREKDEKRLDASVDAAVREFQKSSKPKKLADLFREATKIVWGTSTKDRGNGLIELIDIPDARKRYHIPNPDSPGNIYGGWKNHLGNRTDFYKGRWAIEKVGNPSELGKARPMFFQMAERLGDHADAVENQIEKLKTTPKGKLTDIALILSVVGREDRLSIGSSKTARDSFGKGGLDTFYADQSRLKSKGYLPNDFNAAKGDGHPKYEGKWDGHVYNEIGFFKAAVKGALVKFTKEGMTLDEALSATRKVLAKGGFKYLGKEGLQKRLRPWREKAHRDLKEWEKALNKGGGQWQSLLPLEPRHEVFPAKIPQNRGVEAYGAVINERHDWFVAAAKKPHKCSDGTIRNFSDDTIRNLSIPARRVWTATFFIRPSDGKEMIKEYKEKHKKLEDIVSDVENAKRYDSLKRARVNAAEADLIDKHVLRHMKRVGH